MEYDRKQVVCMALYLDGTAVTWYNDNVDGIDHQRDVWSFKLVITGLYDWFIHHTLVGITADKFWNATYVPEEGIMALYHKLTKHAVRIVQPPDHYTFKSHLIMRMLSTMFNYLLSKEVTMEYSTVEMILYYARRVEENACQRARWSKERQVVEETRRETTMDEQKLFRWRGSYGNNQQYKSKQTIPSTTTMGSRLKCKEPNKETQKSKTRDLEKRTGNEKKENKTDEDICFGCGQKGHKKRDPKCLKNNQSKKVAAQLHAARDIIEEDDEEDDWEVTQPVGEDGGENSEEEEEDPYYRSQYTSEGEEVKINNLEHQEWSNQECAGERMHMMRI
jgi:hypothetical protein